MPELVACPSCSAHVRTREHRCPHCGATLRDPSGRVGRTAGALLMGLALTGCGDKDDDKNTSSSASVGEPDYGVPATSGSTQTGGTTLVGEPEYGVAETGGPTDGSSSTGDGSTGTGTGSTDPGGTTLVGEPDYGVPGTSG